MPLWLLLADKAKGYALELHPAPIQWGRPPRPFSPGPEGENFTDFDLRWLSDTPSKNAQTWGNRWREPLDKNDPLQRSALKSGALAYRLLYHSVDNPLRQQCTVRYQLDEAELLAEGGGRGISGESGDLLFALAVVTVSQPRSGGYPPLAATGVLDEAGRVKYVTGVADKLKAYLTAIANLPETTPVKTDGNGEQAKALFFHPRANDDDLSPELRKTAHQAGVRLIAVESLEEALCALGITVKDYWEGNPYQCFDFFDTVHRRIFFGRETESAIVCETLLQREKDGSPGILVIGSSGRGKSSLVRAGVIPRLQKHEALLDKPIFFYSWRLPDNKAEDDPTASEALLANTLRQSWAHLPELQYIEAAQEGATNTNKLSTLADDLVQVLPQTQRFVWVIDQMEELFSFKYPAATIEAFGAFLKRLQNLGVWPIATLRSEYGHDYQNTNLLEVFGNGYILPKMHETALELAIRKPATLAKLNFETDPETGINLAAHIRDEALQGGEDMLPLLGFVLSELYEDPERIQQNDGWLRWEAYRRLGSLHDASQQSYEQPPVGKPDQIPNRFFKLLALLGLRRKETAAIRPSLVSNQAPHIGGLAGAVGHHANKLLSACTIEERNTLPKVLLHLVHISEDGNQTLRQRARLNTFAAEPQQASLVRKLIDGRLLISHIDANTEEATVELVHDCLLTAWDKVGAAIEQHRELLDEKRKLRNAAQHWERNGREEKLLMAKTDEVIRAELVMARLNDSNTDTTTLKFLEESIKLCRGGVIMPWILGICIGIGASILIWIKSGEKFHLTVLLEMQLLILFLILPFVFKVYRSLLIRAFIESAKMDFVISCINFFVSGAATVLIIKYLWFIKMGSVFGFPVLLPFFVIINFVCLRSVYIAKNNIDIILKVNNFNAEITRKVKFFSIGVRRWKAIEIVVWVFLIVFMYKVWFDWRTTNSILQSMRDLSISVSEFLYNRAQLEIESNKNKDAIIDIKRASEITDMYAFNFFSGILAKASGTEIHYDDATGLKTIDSYIKGCDLYVKVGDAERSKALCSKAIEGSKHWMERDTPSVQDWQDRYIKSLIKQGWTYLTRVDYNANEALKIFNYANNNIQIYLKSYPESKSQKRNLATIYKSMAEIYKEIGKHDLAITYYIQAYQVLDSLVDRDAYDYDVMYDYAGTYAGIAIYLREHYNPELSNILKVIKSKIEKQVFEEQKLPTEKLVKYEEFLAMILDSEAYGNILEMHFDDALSLSYRAIRLSPKSFLLKINLAHSLLLLHKFKEAKKIYREYSDENVYGVIVKNNFRTLVLYDFEKFKAIGIVNPDIDKIMSLVRNN